MSAYTRGRKRDQLRFVNINDILLYGWNTVDLAAATGISAADLKNQLGHLTAAEADAVANRLMVLGANSPKPARAIKVIPNAPTTAAGSVSTFIAYNKRAVAQAAQWKVGGAQKGVRLTAPVAGKRSQTAVAELSNGVLYAFPMNQSDFTLVGETLGLQAAAQISSVEAKKLATGMSSTRPGQAGLEDSEGLLSTFFSTAKRDDATAAGFSIISEERILYPAAAAPPGP
ncbi:hypothetical protein BST81_03535 [Leptolyngbya sp. 'hensonii']|uniref:hypothetical protein n=1 Tax=Leptolyngbya sp. 'hensonii' TaxID=1922337 RepID=UPI00094FC6CA|nr:hypothetical protein [Leptolyngbya sp. 'hensonii']OLP19815.1 hypothetical protein BST81_03535 [Leptolyngbya sp. 'hensonii']